MIVWSRNFGQVIEPCTGAKDNHPAEYTEKFAIQVFNSTWCNQIKLFLDRDTPQRYHWVVKKAIQGAVPGTHKNGIPSNRFNFVPIAAMQ
jgi:hypothetical protein